MLDQRENEIDALRGFFGDPNVRFPARPRLVEDIALYQMPEGLGFQFRGGPALVALRGRDAERTMEFLLPALDGTREIDDLLGQCPHEVSRVTLLKTLFLLHTKGLLAEHQDAAAVQRSTPANPPTDESLRRQLLFWGRKLGISGFARSGAEAQSSLESAQLVLVGTALFGSLTYDILARSGCSSLEVVAWDDDGLLADALRVAPFPPRRLTQLATTSIDDLSGHVRESAKYADLVVVATRNAPARLFRVLNRICLELSCPLLCANDNGMQVEIGPYVQPHASACYTCLEMRRGSVDDFMLHEHFYQQDLARERTAGNSPPLGESVATSALVASLVALEVVRIVTGIAAPTLLNAQLTVPLLTGELSSNRILRVPLCPDCRGGGPALPDPG
jgi:bacteriocin biosynthesis cyclodehydratase domain-containing protein